MKSFDDLHPYFQARAAQDKFSGVVLITRGAGTLWSPALTEAYLTPQVHYRAREGWNQWWGYGLWFYVDAGGQVVGYQKEGINARVSGVIRHFPQRDVSVVILSNMEDGAWEPIWEIHKRVVIA